MATHWVSYDSLMILPYYNQDSFQGVLVTDGTKSYCLFLYQCDLLESSRASIGFSSSGNFFFNHQLSLSPSSSEVACGNTPDSNWNSLLYQIHYDGIVIIIIQENLLSSMIIAGVKLYISTYPKGPIFQVGIRVFFYCRVITPGSLSYHFIDYCLSSGTKVVVYQTPPTTNIYSGHIINSTPNYCRDVVLCRAWDDAGSTAETKYDLKQLTGQYLEQLIGVLAITRIP